ncbi:MAG: hypothetical protein V4662_09325 [Verrucomicrobiota bacterium]
MTTEESSPQAAPQRLGFGKLLLISFALFTGSFVIDQTIRWSDPLDGLLSGLIQIIFTGSSWVVFMLPWSLAVWGIYRWCHWQRFRTHWVLGPAVLQVLLASAGLFVSPPTTQGSFRRFAKAEIPSDAKNIQYHQSGGGLADYSIHCYFECSEQSLEKLATDMHMGEQREMTAEEAEFLSPIKPRPGFPDYTKWVGGRRYSSESRNWFFDIFTDPTKTKVYVKIGCT